MNPLNHKPEIFAYDWNIIEMTIHFYKNFWFQRMSIRNNHLEANRNKSNCLVNNLYKKIEISRTFLRAKQVGEKRGSFQFPVEIAHTRRLFLCWFAYK